MSCSDIEQRITDTATWVDLQLQDIGNIMSKEFRKILYYSLIDSFVQAHYNYPSKGLREKFSTFLLTFSLEKKVILEQTCPITLFYHYNSVYHFDNLKLPDGHLLCAGDKMLQKESERLLSQISDLKNARKHGKNINTVN